MSSKKLFVVKNYSFAINSEEELMSYFEEKEQKKVVTPLKVQYPFTNQYYYSWTESSGVYMYLVFKQPHWNKPKGYVFNRKQTASEPTNTRMCDWCHHFGPADQVGLVTMKANRQTTIGLMLCLDLGCMEKTETITMLSGRSFDKEAQKVCKRMGEFLDYTHRKYSMKNEEPEI